MADRIYRDLFGFDAIIERTDAGILDVQFAIDAVIRPAHAPPVTLQEKFLSPEYAHFRSVTVEYMQNPLTGEQGDWFKLACQLYFVGYLTPDETAFAPWTLVDMARLSAATAQGRLRWHENRNKDGSARASFRYVIMDELPGDCILACEL
jgi:hypothetical protein